jgi:palmitoyltransferase ZDHHC9/14/18
MFVFSAFVFFLYIFVVSSWRIAMKMTMTNKNTLGIIGQMPETFTLATFSLIVVWFLGGLLVFHGYLISLNQVIYSIQVQCSVSV